MNELFIFATPGAATLPLRLALAGTTLCDPSYSITRSCSPYYVLEAVRQGSGRLKVNGIEYEVNPGDCYLLPMYGEHQYASNPDSPWIKHWFNFSGTLIPDLLRGYHLADKVVFPGMFMADRFSEMLTLLESCDMDNRQNVFAGIITRLLAEISAKSRTGEENAAECLSPEAAALRDILMKHLTLPSPPLPLLAKKINRSEAQMLRIFRREFGISPIAYLLDKKLEQAMLMLRDTAFPIKEISAKLGFEDEFYFSRLFRKKCGKSPREYRQEK